MWKGQTELSLNALREFYQRRFTIEHWNRLAKDKDLIKYPFVLYKAKV